LTEKAQLLARQLPQTIGPSTSLMYDTEYFNIMAMAIVLTFLIIILLLVMTFLCTNCILGICHTFGKKTHWMKDQFGSSGQNSVSDSSTGGLMDVNPVAMHL